MPKSNDSENHVESLSNSELGTENYHSTKHELSQLKRMRSIIENECFMLDIEPEFVSKGCEFASYEFQQNFDFAKSVDAGIAVAKKCQHNVKFSGELSLDTSLVIHKTPKAFKSI